MSFDPDSQRIDPPYWLVAESGPLRGQSIEIREGETGIGRDPKNEVAILDSALSRQHCVVVRMGSRILLRDSGSRNQTLVNGKSAHETVLKEGDTIRAGSSEFRLLRYLPLTQSQSNHLFEADDTQTVVLRPAETRYLQAPVATTSVRDVRDLTGLLRFARSLASVRDALTLEERVFDAIRDLTKAEQATLIFTDDADGSILSEKSRRRGGGPAWPVSKTIVRRVMDEGVALLSADVPKEISGAESLVLSLVRSLVAVPMGSAGVLYLDSRSPGNTFDNQDLELAAAIGNIVALAVANLREIESLVSENVRLREDLGITHDLVGDSAPIRTLIQQVARASSAVSNVLVLGESGTGKELVARAIHFNSDRNLRPFIAINCASIPETLIESELFGHEKGAFTNAMVQKKGRFELAHGGTIFLDEIGELTPGLQAKLLRVIQEREIERLGGTKPIKIDVRIIAATHRDLKDMVKSGAFRQDLYFRLNVIPIRTPALRDHLEDVPVLAGYFLEKFRTRTKRKVTGLSNKARELLCRHDWPGNVRELENAIERAVVMGMTEVILPEDFPELYETWGAALSENPNTLQAILQDAKRKALVKALDQCGWNQNEAAQLLDIHPVHLSKTMKALGLRAARKGIGGGSR
jgi:transcriptional regulator with GAF, ATPase, and Fis domain